MAAGAHRGNTGLAVAVCAIAVAATALALLAPPVSLAGDGIVVHELDGSKLSRAQIRRAEPLEPLTRGPAADASTAPSGQATRVHGKPGYVHGYVPASIAAADAASRAGAQASGFGSFTSRAVGAPTTYPNTTVGKVLGNFPGVGTYSCTASVVHARNRSTIFTAGHCVSDPRWGFASALVFIPSYDRGARPFGQWAARELIAKRAWVRKGNSNVDYAAAVLQRSPRGKVEKVVGSQGFAYNVRPKRKDYRAVGYPFNRGNTQVMWECRDRFAGYDPGYRKLGPKPIGIGCDMTSGASGGPWTLPGIYLNSVTSFGYDELPNHLFGPQFTKAAERLRKAAGKR